MPRTSTKKFLEDPNASQTTDVSVQREMCRATLAYVHRPLEGKGRPLQVSLAETWGQCSFRPIVEEMLIAYSEVTAALDSESVQGEISRLCRFFTFLMKQREASVVKAAPKRLSDLSFGILRDFEHWLAKQTVPSFSKLEERRDQLQSYLATAKLPCRFSTKTVSVTRIEKEIGFHPGYISRYQSLIRLVRTAAKRQGLGFREPQGRSRELGNELVSTSPHPLSTKHVEDTFYVVKKVIGHIQRYRPGLLAPGFTMPTLSQKLLSVGGLKSPGLSPREASAVDAGCKSAIRGVKTRILEEGRVLAGKGRPEPARGIGWGKKEDLVAYLAAQAPSQVFVKSSDRPKHGFYISTLKRKGFVPYDIALMLAPTLCDLTPFIIRMGMCEHAPLNLEGILTLHVDLESPMYHCVRESPTPNYKRIFFGKPRAGVDQTYIDVPARGSLDLPGLVGSVIEITKSIRLCAKSEDRNALWLYLSGKGAVRRLRAGEVSTRMLKQFVVQEQILGDDGKLLKNFNFRRLRPTVLGAIGYANGLEEAQRRAAQADPRQALVYQNNPGNRERVRDTVAAAQSKAILSVQSGYRDRPKREEVNALRRELGISWGAAAEIIAGKRDKLFNGCVDDMNGQGPESVGQKCSQYEACLVCPNSVILRRHLPRLMAYYHHWLGMAEELDDETWKDTYELNCSIVEQHLKKFDKTAVDEIKASLLKKPVISYPRFKQS